MAERKKAEVEAVTLGEAFTEYLRARGDLRPKTVKDYQRVMRASFGDWRNGRSWRSPETWWAAPRGARRALRQGMGEPVDARLASALQLRRGELRSGR